MSDAADPVAATRATYDAIAAAYAGRTRTVDERDWLDELVVAVPPGGTVVDVGCGPGREAELLQADGYRAIGLDVSTSMLALARRNGVPVVQGDLRSLPLRDGAVDAVWSCASLLHVPREQTVATLADWRRVTRDGGGLALSTSSGDDEGWEAVPFASEQDERDRRCWFVHRTRDELVSAVTAAGWSVEHVGSREGHRSWHLVRARA
ncbi:MAG TPA: class I SAM-dependent methyltransferase [Mycobacteriales bacterium]|nr:class I SAM-dependent methyltransferase [Mycobacteriales bacterium]